MHRDSLKRLAVGVSLALVLSACRAIDGVSGTGGVGGAEEPSECDDVAIATCLALQTCCGEILVNPVFRQSCNAVVLACDADDCRRVLAGYPQCVSVLDPDAGVPDAG